MRTDPARVKTILSLLDRAYPNPRTELNHRNVFELLIATILSAQCTDERVNRVTPILFKRFPTTEKLARADLKEVEEIIRPTGFYKSKAKSIVGCAQAIVEKFGGEVPRTLEELVTLPGVWRKTANVVLGNCFGQPAIVVDTHVKRVAKRLELTDSEDPDQVEADLAEVLPKKQWTEVSHRMLLHGRYTCKAKTPLCTRCPLFEVCEAPEKYRALKKVKG
jgi:endonuclease-3